MPPAPELFVLNPSGDPRRARLEIDCGRRAAQPLSKDLLGKFCEHLGLNIYQGMDAQILGNPTFAKWRFSAIDHPDGGVGEESDRAKIRALVIRYRDWPDPQRVMDAYFDGCAWCWFPVGEPGQVRMSQDVTDSGQRAQRIEAQHASPAMPQGIAQWIHLPLHRTRGYSYRLVARAVAPCSVTVRLSPVPDGAPSTAGVHQLGREWQTYSGHLEVPAGSPPAGAYALSIVSSEPAHWVVARVFLLPDDHVNGADPDVIRLLREVRLPLLRWPGGNFTSGYHWQDGVGPVDERPTLFNPAWAGVEFNYFGTDEFMAFCRAVGCEPMICVNAGNGTPAEAAAWVEYCNGAAGSRYGSMRARNGHPEPYGIKLWEVGNELWGRWQVGWTTPAGYADRFVRFAEAMHQADPSIELIANGAQVRHEVEWTRELLATRSVHLRCLTDHTLAASAVGSQDDPWDVTQGYLGQALESGRQYRRLRETMLAAGISRPQLAITEMILFAQWQDPKPVPGGMTCEQMVEGTCIAEAAYLATYLCECARLGDFVRLINHTATVNHGGGLRKRRERTYGHPVHHCHGLAAPLAGATPVAVVLTCGSYATKRAYGLIPQFDQVSVVDAISALTPEGDLVVFLVQRGRDPVHCELVITGAAAAAAAEITTLSAAAPWERNTDENPRRIVPLTATAPVLGGVLALDLAPCSVARLVIRDAVARGAAS